MLTFTRTSVTSSSYYISTSKFNFYSDPPKIAKFFQWVTANSYSISSSTSDNYWAYIYVNSYGSSQLKITYWKDATYLKGMSVVIILVKSSSDPYIVKQQTGGSASLIF